MITCLFRIPYAGLRFWVWFRIMVKNSSQPPLESLLCMSHTISLLIFHPNLSQAHFPVDFGLIQDQNSQSPLPSSHIVDLYVVGATNSSKAKRHQHIIADIGIRRKKKKKKETWVNSPISSVYSMMKIPTVYWLPIMCQILNWWFLLFSAFIECILRARNCSHTLCFWENPCLHRAYIYHHIQ